ncbi:hypothetical protein [Amycolatopsis taiwanensis]|uniref:hypothetical protein n=1 Tax=Amycolatopsis taiwanensis TaxID=342230 RepID=UPI000489F7E2|nr:hypothetical protein [Amycolatopsis taiwanensis]
MSGYVEFTSGTGETKSKAGELGVQGQDFAALAKQGKAEHEDLANLGTFGNDKLGARIMEQLKDVHTVFEAMEKIGGQLHTASSQLTDGVKIQEGSELENFLNVNKIKP